MLVQLGFCLDQHQDQDQVKHPSLEDRQILNLYKQTSEGKRWGSQSPQYKAGNKGKREPLETVSEERIKRNLNITSWGSVVLME